MADTIGKLIAGAVERVVRWLVVPVANAVPALVSSGILLVAYGALWLAFAAAIAMSPATLDDAWRAVGELPLPIQALAWLLALPLMAGMWAWQTDWPLAIRLIGVVGLGAFNVLVFIPRRGAQRALPAGSR